MWTWLDYMDNCKDSTKRNNCHANAEGTMLKWTDANRPSMRDNYSEWKVTPSIEFSEILKL